MTTYRITAPHFAAGIVEEGGVIYQTAPVLGWTIGHTTASVINYCRQRGWHVEPVVQDPLPTWIEYDGRAYELHWNGNTLTRITLHESGGMTDIMFDELPAQLKDLL